MIQTLYNGVKLGVTGLDPDNVERLDLPYLPLVHYMMRTGLQVDPSHFMKMEKILTQDMDSITERIKTETGHYINVGSPDQVADLLFSKLGLKQAKKKMTPTGKREAVDDDILTAIQHEHVAVGLVQDYREFSKLRGTYAIPLAKFAIRVRAGEWRIFPNLKTTRVPSGRNACEDPNLLAMPNRTDRGRELCEGFITQDGWVYLSVDFSQIEPRTGAHRSQDTNLCAVYDNDEDIYSDFAIAAFKLGDDRWECQGYRSVCRGRECKDKDHHSHGWHYPHVDKKKHRFPAKTCTLASIYEVSAMGLQDQMPVVCKNCDKESSKHDCQKFESLWTENPCQSLINSFYIRYPGLLEMRKRDHASAKRRAYINDDFGRCLHVAAVRSVLSWVVSAALREAANMPLQGTARGLVKLGETKSFDDIKAIPAMLGDVVRPVLDVHDELLMECREDYVEEVGAFVADIFENIARLRVPLKASTAKARTWGLMPK